MAITINDETFDFLPKHSDSINSGEHFHTLESGYIDLTIQKNLTYKFNFGFNGSRQFGIIPLGKHTKLNVISNWKSPSFTGSFLPNNEPGKVDDNGFNANWEVFYYNRPFPQTFVDYMPDLMKYELGVNLLIPVDEYKKSERSAKYGYLVIVFTFLFFFIVQITSKINIHPFHYLMIGLALIMFYTLLLSISEHSNFLKAYLIAGVSVVGLICFYTKSILNSLKFAVFIGISLIALYSFIYVIIQLESYALLVGSVGLFLILSIVMYVSRKVDFK